MSNVETNVQNVLNKLTERRKEIVNNISNYNKNGERYMRLYYQGRLDELDRAIDVIRYDILN